MLFDSGSNQKKDVPILTHPPFFCLEVSGYRDFGSWPLANFWFKKFKRFKGSRFLFCCYLEPET